ncbi:MAG TPA: hypothetical protein VIY86_10735, partial [Pirellulaceae bacterium]
MVKRCRQRELGMVAATVYGLLLQAVGPAPSTAWAEETARADETLWDGAWQLELETPGGMLPCPFTIARDGDRWNVVIHNGQERLRVEDTMIEQEKIRLEFPHYDSVLELEFV